MTADHACGDRCSRSLPVDLVPKEIHHGCLAQGTLLVLLHCDGVLNQSHPCREDGLIGGSEQTRDGLSGLGGLADLDQKDGRGGNE